MYKVLKFGANWCGPCRELAKGLSRQPITNPNVEFREVDIEEEERLTDAFDIRSLPTIVIMNGTEELARHVGAITVKDLHKLIDETCTADVH